MSVDPEDFDYVRALLKARTGIALDADKAYLVTNRLLPVARAHRMRTVADLVTRIRRHAESALSAEAVDALCTKETSWLRDGAPLRDLVGVLIPRLMTRPRQNASLTVWSAGCAMGQEPFSVAMLLQDSAAVPGWAYRILATDISATALARARSGRYRQTEISRGLPRAMLVTHFHRESACWRISQSIRDQVQFERANLVDDPPPVLRADVVLLRNVLIYFDLPTRRRVLEKVRGVLAPGGLLLLGAGETTVGISDGWARTRHGQTTFYRNEGSGLVTEFGEPVPTETAAPWSAERSTPR